MKKDINLLASIALFGELYDNKKDIYDVIAELLKAAIISEGRWSFTSIEAVQLLESHFDFKVPDAVVKQALRTKLLKESQLSFENGIYLFNPESVTPNKFLGDEFEKLKGAHVQIFDDLVKYVEGNYEGVLAEVDFDELRNNFHSFLLDKGISDKHTSLIGSFIIRNAGDELFKSRLNAIKEGLVVYSGVRYTSDLNSLGSWNTDFTIFFDTEILFSAVGYNGVLYEQVFNDFYKLVNEVNSDSLKKLNKKRIELKYFVEIKREADDFFFVAEKVLEGKARLDPSKTAMINILNGCRY